MRIMLDIITTKGLTNNHVNNLPYFVDFYPPKPHILNNY